MKISKAFQRAAVDLWIASALLWGDWRAPVQASQPRPGALDRSFDPQIAGDLQGGWSGIHALALQPDGRILVGGHFVGVQGHPRRHLARLHPDGSLDPTFTPRLEAADAVNAIAVHPDGRIWIGGRFKKVNEQRREALALLDSLGELDPEFEVLPGISGTVDALAADPDGTVVLGGSFESFDPALIRLMRGLGRLDAHGIWDSKQRIDLAPGGGFLRVSEVTSLVALGAGRIAAAGWLPCPYKESTLPLKVAVFGAEGQLELPNPERLFIATGEVNLLGFAQDRLFVSNLEDKVHLSWLHRLNADGSRDDAFPAIRFSGRALCCAIQPNGKVIVGGDIEDVWGAGDEGVNYVQRRSVARVNPDGSPDATFQSGRGVDGIVETVLLLPDGKILVGGSFQTVDGEPRLNLARLHGGEATPPAITREPGNQTAILGMTVTLEVEAKGSEPLAYQWFNRGTELRDATAPTLVVPDVQSTETLRYTVVVSSPFGMVTSQVARITVQVPPTIKAQPVDRLFKPGNSFSFEVWAEGASPLSYQWYFNDLAIPNATESNYGFDNAQADRVGSYHVVVTNPNGSVRSAVVMLKPGVVQPGALDSAFAPGRGLQAPRGGINVSHILPLPGGRILIGGTFTNVAGLPRSHLAVLDTNGVGDPSFNAELPADLVLKALARQSDGSLVVGGELPSRTTSPGYLVRLDRQGALAAELAPDPGWMRDIRSVTVQPDDGVIIGGWFSHVSGHPRTNLARLHAGLTLDASFMPELPDPMRFSGPDNSVFTTLLDADGNLIFGGPFTKVHAKGQAGIARLTSDGSLDETFNPGLSHAEGGLAYVNTLARQLDGRILIGGNFTHVGGLPRRGVARLSSGGAVDSSFISVLNPGSEVSALALQADGQVLLGGRFEIRDRGQVYGVVRLFADGSYDPKFGASVGLSAHIRSLYVQPDQKVCVGGVFSVDNPQSLQTQSGIARYLPGESVAPFFLEQPQDGMTATDTSGVPYFLMGLAAGTWPISYFWEKDAVLLPGETNRVLLMRGMTADRDGRYTLTASNEFGLARSRYATLKVLDEVVIEGGFQFSQTVVAGTNLTWTVTAKGGPPLRFEWFKNAVRLPTVTSNRLVLDPVTASDAGNYQAFVSNPLGRRVPASAAFLTVVVPPILRVPPHNQIGRAGTDIAFSVLAEGTAPLRYQWRKEGTTLAGQTNATLLLTNLVASQAGAYSVGITNSHGQAVSAPAELMVLVPPTINAHPSDLAVSQKGNAGFTAAANGTEPLAWQWTVDGHYLPGATAPALLLTNVQPQHAGLYGVMVQNAAGTCFSQSARLTVVASETPIRELTPAFNPEGLFSLTATVAPGRYRIEGSEDLLNWSVLWTQEVADGRLRFSDPDSHTLFRRYYRIALMP